MGTFKSQSVTCYAVSTACDVIKPLTSTCMMSVSVTIFGKCISIYNQPAKTAKHSWVLSMAFIWIILFIFCDTLWSEYGTTVSDNWYKLKMIKYYNISANQSSVYHPLLLYSRLKCIFAYSYELINSATFMNA